MVGRHMSRPWARFSSRQGDTWRSRMWSGVGCGGLSTRWLYQTERSTGQGISHGESSKCWPVPTISGCRLWAEHSCNHGTTSEQAFVVSLRFHFPSSWKTCLLDSHWKGSWQFMGLNTCGFHSSVSFPTTLCETVSICPSPKALTSAWWIFTGSGLDVAPPWHPKALAIALHPPWRKLQFSPRQWHNCGLQELPPRWRKASAHCSLSATSLGFCRVLVIVLILQQFKNIRKMVSLIWRSKRKKKSPTHRNRE